MDSKGELEVIAAFLTLTTGGAYTCRREAGGLVVDVISVSQCLTDRSPWRLLEELSRCNKEDRLISEESQSTLL